MLVARAPVAVAMSITDCAKRNEGLTFVASAVFPRSQAVRATSAQLTSLCSFNFSTITRQISSSASAPLSPRTLSIFACAQCLRTGAGERLRKSDMRSDRRCCEREVRREMRCEGG